MTLIGLTVLSTLVLTLAILLVRRLGTGSECLPVTTEWLEDLSDERFRPMLRLLEESDFRFLRAQKGFTPVMEKRLRGQRVEVFRGYLKMLEGDFKRVCMALRIVMVQSEYDRPDLASVLIHRQLTFACGILSIEFRLVLFHWGIATVDASELVRMFDGMRLELKTLVPMTSPVAA
jgi:hypothetical protein